MPRARLCPLGSVKELDVAAAMTRFFLDQSRDAEFRRSCHPGMSVWGEQAYGAYLDDEIRKLRNFKPRVRDGRIHISFLANAVGFNCDRALFFEMQCQPEEPPEGSEAHMMEGMLRCWAVGHAMEKEVYKWLAPALEYYYRDRLEILRLEFEQPVFRDAPAEFRSVSELLVGTADVFIDYRLDGEELRGAIDAKSTSANQAKKRDRGGGRVEAEDSYLRQLSLYSEPGQRDWGAVLYWTKGWPHSFNQAPAVTRPGYFAQQVRRLVTVEGEVAGGTPPPATRGSHCHRCAFRRACAQLEDA